MSFIISFEGFSCLHCHCVLMLYFVPRGERMVTVLGESSGEASDGSLTFCQFEMSYS